MEIAKAGISWIHIITASLAMLVGSWTLFSTKATGLHKKSGSLYFYLMVVTNITALFIYNVGGFFFPHWLAIVTLLIIIPGFVFARYKLFKSWLVIHIICLTLSYYLLIGGAINEAFLRISFLKPVTGTQPLAFNLAHVFAQVFFIGLLVYFLIRRKEILRQAAK